MLVGFLIESTVDCVPARVPSVDCEVGKRRVGHTMEAWPEEPPLTRPKSHHREVIAYEATGTGVSGGEEVSETDDATGSSTEAPRFRDLREFTVGKCHTDGGGGADGPIGRGLPKDRPRPSNTVALNHPGSAVKGRLEVGKPPKGEEDARIISDGELLV